MHLTEVLLRYRNKWRPRPFPKGSMWRGKFRVVRQVTNLELAQVRDDLATEEKNMFYLRHPYLKANDGKLLNKTYLQLWKNTVINNREERFQRFRRYNNERTVDGYVKRVLSNSDAWE